MVYYEWYLDSIISRFVSSIEYYCDHEYGCLQSVSVPRLQTFKKDSVPRQNKIKIYCNSWAKRPSDRAVVGMEY